MAEFHLELAVGDTLVGHTAFAEGVEIFRLGRRERPSSARDRLANKLPTILLFIPAESDTKADAMDGQTTRPHQRTVLSNRRTA